MPKLFLMNWLIVASVFLSVSCSDRSAGTKGSGNPITPNQFKGNDITRIQSAIRAAQGTTNQIVIPAGNSNGTNLWLIDSAILLPGNMTVILDNCTIRLSDQCRDNMFRSDNVGEGITDPVWNKNISIIGIGDVFLRGASNPRATGDGARTLVSDNQKGRVSYGSDAGKEGIKQKGDWRNIMILMGYVDGFKLKNVNIENAHAWAVSFERTVNAELSDIHFDCREFQNVNGKEVFIANRDGIDLRHGCKNFRMNNLSGKTGDDFIALSILGLDSDNQEGGTLNSTMVTSRKWRGSEDDTERIFVTNITCESSTRAIAIRANDVAGINHVYINGLLSEGGYNAMLMGGKGYGKDSQPGKISHIHGMNIIGGGRHSLIQIEGAIADCSFMNGIYKGSGDQIVTYKIDQSETDNVVTHDLIKVD